MTLEEFGKVIESKKQPLVINKGIGPLSLLGIAFVVMKATGYITWSWWWILAPFWIPMVIALVLVLVLLAMLTYVAAKTDVKIEETFKKDNGANAEEAKETTNTETDDKPKVKPVKRKKPKVNNNGENNTTGTEGKNE